MYSRNAPARATQPAQSAPNIYVGQDRAALIGAVNPLTGSDRILPPSIRYLVPILPVCGLTLPLVDQLSDR